MCPNVVYFAYGSNMCTERLRSRICYARAVGRAKLLDKRMVCNKESEDGSGKANLIESPGDVVWGVLYEVDSSELDKLDRAEGGYERVTMQVLTHLGDLLQAEVYRSDRLSADPTPYHWYKERILRGARKHELPTAYLQYLEQLPSKPDRKEQRR